MMRTALQQNLWHDTIYDALRDLVTALGGPKKVGLMLWPSAAMSEAQRRMLHCLDPERPEKLAPDEVLLLMAEGRRAGCHVLAQFYAQHCFYEFKVTNPEDRRRALQQEYVDAVKRMEDLAKRMQQDLPPSPDGA